jgi:hypothetical protein
LLKSLEPSATLVNTTDPLGERIPYKITLNGKDHMILNIDESQKKELIAIVKQSKPTAERIQLYEQLGLCPKDFGSVHSSWTAWADEHSGPIVDGATLTSADVKALREALQAVARQLQGVSYYRSVPSTYHAILRKVGLRPSDCGLSGSIWSSY